MKFQVLDVDCPWNFSDSLTMSSVKRGAKSQYKSIMTLDDIKALKISEISEDDSLLALWCPSTMLQDGLDTMKAWGFEFKQTWIWVKTKKIPLINLIKQFSKVKLNAEFKNILGNKNFRLFDVDIIKDFDINEILDFGMGRLFRQTHEICLIGTKGKIYSKLKNKSQRSVYFDSITEHSAKPEGLQDMLDIMFEGDSKFAAPKVELFARRYRPHWVCCGNENFITQNEDIRKSIDKLIVATGKSLSFLDKDISEKEKAKLWKKLPF